MDRTTAILSKSILVAAAICLGLALQSAARGDTVMMSQPSQPSAGSDEAQSFPESRFGFEPAKVNPGIGPSYAAKATEEMDEEEVVLPAGDSAGGTRAPGKTSRRPAGLEYSDDSQNRPPTVPIRPDPFRAANEFNRENRGNTDNPVAGAMSNPMLQKGVQEVAVIAGDLGFFPKTLFVVRDLPVRMYVTGSSRSTLCIMMDAFQVRKQVRSQRIEEITFTPALPGKYRFYCPVNGMEGTLIVKELSTAAPSEPTADRGGRPMATERTAYANGGE